MTKSAGIVIDNYKIDHYKKTLKENGFTDYEVSSYIGSTSVIQVKFKVEDFDKLQKMCRQNEIHFKTNKS